MVKKCLIVATLLFLSNIAAAETKSYFDVKFRSIDCKVIDSSTTVYFEWVYLDEKLHDIAVLLDKTDLIFQSSTTNYTTLDIINVKDDGISSTLGAEKVIVRVRDEKDLRIWQKYLATLKRKQEKERERRRKPIRVLPPKL